MAKNRKRHKRAKVAAVDPLIALAKSNGANLKDGSFAVVETANPYGEVIIRGEIRRHKAVRRVPTYETLHKRGKIDRATLVCLEWFADRLSLAHSGLIRCGLNVSGGGSPTSHIPTTEAAMIARSDVDWAREFIRDLQARAVFDCVMSDGHTFERVGALVFPSLSLDTSQRKASRLFHEAALALRAGIGAKVIGEDRS